MNNSIENAYHRIKNNLEDKSDSFKNILIENYTYFLEIRSYNKNCSPSDLIDMLWHSHIIDTEGYINYCNSNFGQIIHHDPNDSLDQLARQTRLSTTIEYFKNNNKSHLLDKNIWNINVY